MNISLSPLAKCAAQAVRIACPVILRRKSADFAENLHAAESCSMPQILGFLSSHDLLEKAGHVERNDEFCNNCAAVPRNSAKLLLHSGCVRFMLQVEPDEGHSRFSPVLFDCGTK